MRQAQNANSTSKPAQLSQSSTPDTNLAQLIEKAVAAAVVRLTKEMNDKEAASTKRIDEMQRHIDNVVSLSLFHKVKS
jgi:hypothetical protein